MNIISFVALMAILGNIFLTAFMEVPPSLSKIKG